MLGEKAKLDGMIILRNRCSRSKHSVLSYFLPRNSILQSASYKYPWLDFRQLDNSTQGRDKIRRDRVLWLSNLALLWELICMWITGHLYLRIRIPGLDFSRCLDAKVCRWIVRKSGPSLYLSEWKDSLVLSFIHKSYKPSKARAIDEVT